MGPAEEDYEDVEEWWGDCYLDLELVGKTTEESGTSGLYVYGLDVNVKFPDLSTEP